MNHSLDILQNYGITLKRLSHDKIETVRRWRNDPKISQFMEFRDEITPQMQQKWFDSINNDNNLFYIVVFRDEEIGLINIKNICNGSGEGGIFIWNDTFLNSDISYRAHLVLFDAVFNRGLLTEITSHVLSDNLRAQRFTRFLGFEIAENQSDVYNQLYRLNRLQYFENKNRQRFLKRYNKSES